MRFVRQCLLVTMNSSKIYPFCRWWTCASSLRHKSSASGAKDNVTAHWRKTFKEKGEWTSKFDLFSQENVSEGPFLRFIRSPLDFRPATIKRWLKRKQEDYEMFDQSFSSDRHTILGNDLATAHFILHRGGKVKFRNENNWHVGKDHNLPTRYTSGYDLEAVDATDVNMYYEGFSNFVDLKYFKSLSLRNCKHVDDWCLDYISGELQALEYLDLQNCQNVTENGLACLYRLQRLKILNVSNIPQTRHFELTCLLLEEIIPGLNVEGVKYIKL